MNIRMAVASKYQNIPHFLLFKHRRMIIVFEVKIKHNIVFLCIDYKLRRHSFKYDKSWFKTGVPLIFNIYNDPAISNDKQQQQTFSLLCFNYLQKYCNLT